MINRLLCIKITTLLLMAAPVFSCFGQSPRLEIHHIGVGDGDAILLIAIDETTTGYKDTVTALIDGNRSSKPGAAIWSYVKDTLNKLAPNRKKLDFLILSHLHIDHYGGLLTVVKSLQEAGWGIDYVIDREGAGNKPNLSWSIDSNYKYECVDEEIDYQNYTSTANRYVILTSKYTRVTIAPGIDIFSLKKFKNMSMVCLASMGAALANNMQGYSMFLRTNTSGVYVPYNENDLSFVFNVGFKAFNYFMGGDIGGGKPYADGETPIVNYLKAKFNSSGAFHYCGLKVSHHGSAHSTNDNFLGSTTPTMAVIQANLRTYGGTALPTEATVQALVKALPSPSTNLKFCFEPVSPGTASNYWTKGKLAYYQDVCVKVFDVPAVGTKSIPMQIITRKRKSADLSFSGGPVVSTITCTQAHPYSFK